VVQLLLGSGAAARGGGCWVVVCTCLARLRCFLLPTNYSCLVCKLRQPWHDATYSCTSALYWLYTSTGPTTQHLCTKYSNRQGTPYCCTAAGTMVP
jgi:hypothetical protein